MSRLCREVHEQLFIETKRTVERLRNSDPPVKRLLDVGCWDGIKTAEYGRAAGLDPSAVYGVDCFDEVLAEANRRITAVKVDLEACPLPFESGAFDVVVCNQVSEHLKQIYRPMSEIRRLLSPGGALIFSVPNLASLHNRLLLMAGWQPTAVRLIGPHVRGFTSRAAREFLELNDLFRVERQIGVGFYPLPMAIARPLARMLTSLSHTIILVARKGSVIGVPEWNDAAREATLQTKFD